MDRPRLTIIKIIKYIPQLHEHTAEKEKRAQNFIIQEQ